jgi:transcriptional regulator with XRE-family HTH domain
MTTRHESHIRLASKKLLGEMNKRGLSAAQLARQAGVSPTTISAILTREQRVTTRTARRISEALFHIQKVHGLGDLMADDEVA